MTAIVAIVCGNGLGHLRRTTGILAELQRSRPDLRITLVARKWQIERVANWPAWQALLARGMTCVPDLLGPGVQWHTEAHHYDDGRLMAWLGRLPDVPGLLDARMVLSDNLPGVLAYRSDAIVLGSFLWSDVLEHAYPDSPAVMEFVAHERECLVRHRPPMICIDAMAMPGVRTRTTAVGFPWMVEPSSILDPPVLAADDGATTTTATTMKRKRRRVALVGGATGMVDAALMQVAQMWHGITDVELALPRQWRGASVPDAVPFDFCADDYRRCHLVVCRPGIGTVTDCVAHAIPMVAVYEPENLELQHNARRLAEMGMAVDAGFSTPAELSAAIQHLLDGPGWAMMHAQLAMQPTDGLSRAARWLFERLTAS